MKRLLSLLFVFAMTVLTGSVHNKNRKAFQSSILKTEHRVNPTF